MPLFRIYNYDKPGKGVSKDEPKKSAFANFFSILGGRLTRLIQLNLLFMIPFCVVFAFCLVLFFLPITRYDLIFVKGSVTYQFSLWNFYVVPLPFIFLSPFFAGLTYVTRNYTRREHAFIYMDSKEAIAKNWKQFLLNGIVTYILYVLLSFADIYYYASLNESWVYGIPFAICVIATLVLLFASYYVPIMMLMFDLKLGQIYKNALIFSILGLVPNLIITGVSAGLLFLAWKCLTYNILTLLLVLLFVVLFLFSFHSFLTNYCVYPIIEKYLIIPYYGEHKDEGQSDFQFKYERRDEEEEETSDEELPQSEYVYYNGRLIKREELQKREDSIFKDTH